MNKTLRIVTSAALGLLSLTAARAQNLSPEQTDAMERGVALVDKGQYAKGIEIFDSVLTVVPGNYVALYEKAYALSANNEHAKAAEMAKQLVKHKEADALAYAMLGNELDYMGRRSDAVKTYKKGLKKFPKSGMLLAELGNVSMAEGRKDEALQYYEQGIENEPTYDANYYRAANIYLDSNEPVWGMLYAEVYILLNNNKEREAEMAAKLYDAYISHINVIEKDGKNMGLSIGLTAKSVKQDKNGQIIDLPFECAYEMAIAQTGAVERMAKTGNQLDRNQVYAMRKELALNFHTFLRDRFRVSLLEHQYMVIKKGFWDVYCHVIFSSQDEDEFAQWSQLHQTELNDFFEWINLTPFEVSEMQPTSKNKVVR